MYNDSELLPSENYYRGDVFTTYEQELWDNDDYLHLTYPDVINTIHKEYINTNADIIEANNISANYIF